MRGSCVWFFFNISSFSYEVERRRVSLAHVAAFALERIAPVRHDCVRPGYEILENLRVRAFVKIHGAEAAGWRRDATRDTTRKNNNEPGGGRNAPDTRNGFRGDKNIAYDRDDAMSRAKRDLSKSRLNDGDANDAACNRVSRGSNFSCSTKVKKTGHLKKRIKLERL